MLIVTQKPTAPPSALAAASWLFSCVFIGINSGHLPLGGDALEPEIKKHIELMRYFNEQGNIKSSNPDSLHNSIQKVITHEIDKKIVHPLRPGIKLHLISE